MVTAPTTYAIRVLGHLDDHWCSWLGDLDITRDDGGTTTLTVSNADQAQLYGVLAGLRDVGAVIIELRTIDAPFQPDGHGDLQSAIAARPKRRLGAADTLPPSEAVISRPCLRVGTPLPATGCVPRHARN